MYKYVVVLGLLSTNCYAQVYGWANSPLNPDNSPYAVDNSPYNPVNSPYNTNNSPYNFSSPNNVFDNDGDWIGYTVQTPTGTSNYFNADGERVGYNN